MECGKLTAKLRDAVPVCFIEDGKEVKRFKNIEIPDEIKKLPFQDFEFSVPVTGAITFKIMFEEGVSPKNWPEARVLSRVMRKYNSVTYEVGKAKAEQAAGMFGLAAGQRAASCPSRVAKPLAKPLTGGWRSATYARSQQSAPCFSRSICSSDFMLM